MITQDTTLARAVLEHSACADVFRRHRVDYCCGGKRSIRLAALDAKLEPGALLAELEGAMRLRPDDRSGALLEAMSTLSVVAYVVSRHHDYLRRVLPFLRGAADKVVQLHGANAPHLHGVRDMLARMTDELLPHLEVEEQHLFPAMVARKPDLVAIQAHIPGMEAEHSTTGRMLADLRAAAQGYLAPAEACPSWRGLYAELGDLETDLLRHMHVESHVLMARFTGK